MALLNEEDEKQKQAQPGQPQQSPIIQPASQAQPTPAAQPQAQPAGQPVNPIVPQSGMAKPSPAQGAPTSIPAHQPQRKGTGFTNLNRIMQANQGNKLGQTVAGGVTGQVQNLQSGIQKSQQNFQTEAQKNRIDTPEAAALRSSVLGRFDEANVTPDESKFQLSQGLTSQYEQQKEALTGQQTAASTASGAQKAALQSEKDKINAEIARLKALPVNYHDFSAGINKNKIKALEKSLGSVNSLMATYGGVTAGQDKEIADKLANLEAQYGEMSAAEKAAWIQSEKDKAVAANLPSDEEMESFRKYQTGAYAGPQELGDFQSLLGKAQQTEDLGTLARSSGGRQELLKQFVGGRDYTQGQRGLDEAILARGDNSLLSRAAKKAQGAEKQVTQANKLAGAQAQEFVSKAKQFGEETRGMIGAARDPLSQRIDEQMKAMQAGEEGRAKDLTSLQGILSGSDANTKNLDATSRMGIALQSAQDAGYLKQGDVQALLGPGGLVQRAQTMGLDPNKMISDYLSNKASVGIDRRAAATSDQEARIKALDKLMGKSGTDVEFGSQPTSEFQAGGLKFDTKSMADFIAKSEAEKLKDPQFAEKMKQAQLTPLGQILGGTVYGASGADQLGGQAALGVLGTTAAAGSLLGTGAMAGMGVGGPLALAAMLGGDILSGGDSTAKLAEGAVQVGSGLAGGARQVQVGALDALQRLAGDNKQLGQIKDAYSSASGNLIQGVTNEAMNWGGGLRDLTQTGKLDQALMKLSGADALKHYGENLTNMTGKAINDVGKAASTALFGGETGNWSASDYKIKDVDTGKDVKIANMAGWGSDKILKQMLSQGTLGQLSGDVTSSSGKGFGYNKMNELLKYYNAALKREGKA